MLLQFTYLFSLHPHNFYKTIFFLATGFVLLLCSFSCHATEKKHIFSIGIVPQFETRKLHQIWRPILDAVEQQTDFQLEIKGSSSIPDFEKKLMSGEFDFAYMNPYHLLLANKSQGYTPLIRDHGRKLYGILVIKRDSPLHDIRQLDGQQIAFPAPNALGASLLIRADLKDIFNIDVVPKYVKSHDSVYLNTALGQTVAGGGVQKTLSGQNEQLKNLLKVFYKTRDVSPHPIAAHPRIPEHITNKITQSLLSINKTDTGKSLLKKIPIKKIGLASLEDYTSLSELKLERFHEINH